MDTPTLCNLAWIFFALLFSPVIFILLDYWSGTRKAKRNGIPLMSHGMRKSVSKACTYYNALLALAVVDALQLWGLWYIDQFYEKHIILFPWLTMAGAVCVAAIEIKSIMESADAKMKKQVGDVMELAKAIAANRTKPEEIAEAIVKYMNSNGSVTEKNG